MRKTSIYLEPETDAALARIAEREGITKAEVVRRTLAAAVDADRDDRRRVRAIGVGSGPGDVSSDIDRHLAETGFGER